MKNVYILGGNNAVFTMFTCKQKFTLRFVLIISKNI